MWQDVAEASHVAVDTALQSLPGFPAAHQLPKPIRLDKTGGFVYEDNVWLLAVSKTQQPDVGNRKRPWPGKSTADRTMICQSWQLRLSTLSRAADDYLLREHRLRAFAADAGAGGDCFFLSVAAALETLRAEQHNLPLSLEQLFSVDVSRGAMVRRLRGIVGQGVMNWGPKQFLDFATTCLANEVGGMWLDSWKMSRLIANTPFAFLQGVNSVHDLTLDAANTLILHCKHGESPNLVQHRIDAGRDVLTKMQRAVADNISQVGNNHWATHTDVDILSQELHVCFCIFGNEPVQVKQQGSHGAASVLHSYAATMDGAEVCICLYNISYQHFELVFLDLESGFQSAFRLPELPLSLAEAMTKANP